MNYAQVNLEGGGRDCIFIEHKPFTL